MSSPTPSPTLYSYSTIHTHIFTFIEQAALTISPSLYSYSTVCTHTLIFTVQTATTPHIYLNCMVSVKSAPTPSYKLYSYITVFTKTFTFIVQTAPTSSPILYSLHYILHPHIHLHCPVTVQSAPTPLCSLYNMHPQLHLHCAVTGQFPPTPSPTLNSYRKVWTNTFTITVQLPHSLHQYLHLHQPPIALKPDSIFKKTFHKKVRCGHYLSYACLVSHVFFVAAVIFNLLCRDIFRKNTRSLTNIGKQSSFEPYCNAMYAARPDNITDPVRLESNLTQHKLDLAIP